MNKELELKVRDALEERLTRLGVSSKINEAQEHWSLCLESVGAKRLDRLLGMAIDKPQGHVRVVDPLKSGGVPGFIEMADEVAKRVLAIGIP